MKLKTLYLSISLLLLLNLIPILTPSAHAQETTTDHITIIINQVRGTECCDTGSIANLNQQINTLTKLNLPATFTLRYDALNDTNFTKLLPTHYESSIGAFLEVIPSLANDAGVHYQGSEDTWYQAHHAYLIGYSQEDRAKLIDTYMTKYQDVFGEYPSVTTAWMIDSWSLKYLKEKYGVQVHQITREQMGTDSYSLYGGPPHYPYYPSQNWTLIPDPDQADTMPLIVRQTITDPVMNYGDSTNSYTSQPNDYKLGDRDLEYFKHLFNQTHNAQRITNSYTFTLIGLENSMPTEVQDEYFKQLEYVADWVGQDENNQVIPANQLPQSAQLTTQNAQRITIYEGKSFDDSSESAYWITTPHYRLRLRQSQDQLYISDIRIYDPDFKGPYYDTKAENFGWWIVPFVLDGSRYFYGDESMRFETLANDGLKDRKKEELTPGRITLEWQKDKDVEMQRDRESILFLQNQQPIAEFFDNNFKIKVKEQLTTNKLIDTTIQNLQWKNEKGQKVWGLDHNKNNGWDSFTVFIANNVDLDAERKTHQPLLFPEITYQPIDPNQSYVFKNNTHAIAGRNPVRLVYFPTDQYGYPALIETYPRLETNPEIDSTNIEKQHGRNGMIFLDFNNDKPMKTTATITHGNFEEKINIYFAPNCKSDVKYCLVHPRQAWWYVRTIIGDRVRALQED